MIYITQILRAFKYSLWGLRFALKERAFQLELMASVPCFAVIFWCDKAKVEKSVLVLTIFVIFIAEVLNTAIERTVDRVSLQRHELSKQAKDIGSFAVLLSIVNFVIIWLVIFA